MPYKKKGRPRKDGPAKRASGEACWKRYKAAMQKVEDGTVNKKDLGDIRVWLEVKRKKAESGHGQAVKAFKQTEEALEKAERVYGKAKLVEGLTDDVGTDVSLDDLSSTLIQVVNSLQNGEMVEGYTLIPTSKASTNQTVEPLYDLGNGSTLCKIKG